MTLSWAFFSREHFPRCPKTAVGHHRARIAPATYPLRRATITTQNTFNWFDSDLSAGSRHVSIKRNSTSTQLEYPLHSPLLLAPATGFYRIAKARYFVMACFAPPHPKVGSCSTCPHQEDTSSQSLQPTDFHGNPQAPHFSSFQACAVLTVASSLLPPVPHQCAEDDLSPSTPASDSHEGISDPK